ncbi:MAG: hypothetical protein Q9222_004166 [Ikaeria aurantiellina]
MNDPASTSSNANALLTVSPRYLTTAGMTASLLLLILTLMFPRNEIVQVKNFFQETGDATRSQHQIAEYINEPWSSIPPSRELEYHDCFSGFQCARIDLPMDWNQTDLTAGPRVQLAVARLPAKVPVTDHRYGGILWLQSGGPGESGIDFILKYGECVQAIVDSTSNPDKRLDDFSSSTETRTQSQNEDQRFYDIISIDSRGLNNSTPCFSCFPSTSSKQLWNLQSVAEGALGSSDTAFSTIWARSEALSKGCSAIDTKLAYHVNTAPQIADMVAIIEQHGQWREREASKLFVEWHDQSVLSDKRLAFEERTEWKKGQEKLLFWGFSYGTVIGAHFAAMQPHRIERMILDGVVDTPDYMLGTRLHSLWDIDSVVDRQAENCFLAGAERCPLYTTAGSVQIATKIRSTILSLKDNLLGVPGGLRGEDGRTLAPDLITYSDILSTAFSALYAPIADFPPLVSYLADISNGNGTSFAFKKQKATDDLAENLAAALSSSPSNANPEEDSACLTQRLLPGDTREAIMCTDVNSTYGITQSVYRSYIAELRTQCPFFADIFAQVRMKCIDWSLRPSWRFDGPFSAQTAHPLLMLSAVRDPVTPLKNAHTLSTRFPPSVVLAVDSEGHSSLSTPSLCMAHHIRSYFATGALPPPDTVCEANEKSFLGVFKEAEGEEDAELLEVLRRISWGWNE